MKFSKSFSSLEVDLDCEHGGVLDPYEDVFWFESNELVDDRLQIMD
jgi:hypothetical protein